MHCRHRRHCSKIDLLGGFTTKIPSTIMNILHIGCIVYMTYVTCADVQDALVPIVVRGMQGAIVTSGTSALVLTECSSVPEVLSFGKRAMARNIAPSLAALEVEVRMNHSIPTC